MQLNMAPTSSKRRGKRVQQSSKKTACERLKALRARTGLSTHDIARALGYASASSYHKYERPAAQKARPIPIDIVRRLVPLFRGRGDPPVTEEEMLALTDLGTALPKSVVAEYMSPTVDDGKGLLVVRYRVEPGVFTAHAIGGRQYGASRIGASAEYDVQKQFVVVCVNGPDTWYKKGTQLHCVEPTEFPMSAMRKKHVVVAAPYKGGELAEIVVAQVTTVEASGLVMVGIDGVPVEGKVLGVVIGFYSRE